MSSTKLLTKRKIILLAVLVACAVFLITQHSMFVERNVTAHTAAAEGVSKTTLQASSPFTGKIKPDDSFLKQLEFTFDNPVPVQTKGTVTVNILDKNNKTVAAAALNGTDIKHKEAVAFKFDKTLEKGEEYTFSIDTSAYSNPNGNIRLWTDAKTGGAYFNEVYTGFDTGNFVECMALLILAAIFILLPWSRFTAKIDLEKLWARIFFFLTPFYTFWIVERMSGGSIGHMVSLTEMPYVMPLNLLIYAAIWIVLYAIINRTRYTTIISTSIGFAFGTINYLLLTFRGSQLLASDFSGVRTAMNVMGSYKFTWDINWIYGLVFFICMLTAVLSLKRYKGLKLKFRIPVIILAIAAVFIFHHVFFTVNVPKENHISVRLNNPAMNYTKNGSALSFTMTVTYTIVDKPDGYSKTSAEKAAKGYTSDSKTAFDKKAPNVIVVMNESFADLDVNKKTPLSQDNMPFVHSMKENTVKGHLYMSIFGGQTPNSEFEFLTGNSLAFMPFRCVPFKNYITEKTPNLTYTLEDQGYTGNTAVHPFVASGWNRTTAYPNLGFKDSLFIDDFDKNTSKYVRQYISDETDYDKLIELYNANKKKTSAPFYVFNVTMQNHGGYTDAEGVVDAGVSITDSALSDEKTKNYVNLIKKSDEAVEKLVNYFKSVDDDTIIVFFGDHQPLLGNNYYKYAFGKNYDDLGFKDSVSTYQVPYFIWANYDIKEETKDMSANYLSSYLLKTAGLKMTGYNKYLLDLQEDLPVINSISYTGSDKKLYDIDNKDTKYKDKLLQYQTLQYNMMFDKKNMINDFFYLK